MVTTQVDDDNRVGTKVSEAGDGKQQRHMGLPEMAGAVVIPMVDEDLTVA